MATENALDNAIAEAAEKLEAETPAAEEPTTEETSEDGEPEEPEVGEADEDDLDEEKIKEAKILYKALSDPKQGPAIIAALAQRAGILQTPPTTHREETQAKKDILSIFKEKLGASFEFLAAPLSEAIETVLENERAAQSEQMERLNQANLTREIDTVLTSLAKESKGESRKLEGKMVQLMNEFHPAPNMSIEKYVRGIYNMARGSGGPQKVNTDKVRRNANDIPSRLSSTAQTGTRSVKIPDKKMSLDESVKFAMGELFKE